jgi:hypothetical protein
MAFTAEQKHTAEENIFAWGIELQLYSAEITQKNHLLFPN